MKPILGDWTHWGGKGFHLGFHRYGNCWEFKFYKRDFSQCVFYGWWRFFIAFDKKRESDSDIFF